MHLGRFVSKPERTLFLNITKLTQPNGGIMTTHLLNRLPRVCYALAVLLGLTITAQGSVPSMEVTVFNAAEKVAFKGPISANGIFATRSLPSGDYVVQFNTKSGAVKNNQYFLVVSAGRKKVFADAVPGEKLTGGGAAMKIQVGSGTRITGQVVDQQAMAQGNGAGDYRFVNGKRYVLVRPQLGSNGGPHWEEVGTHPMRNVYAWRIEDIQNWQNRGGEGSMIPYHDNYGGPTRGY